MVVCVGMTQGNEVGSAIICGRRDGHVVIEVWNGGGCWTQRTLERRETECNGGVDRTERVLQ